jgi:metal-sulfur cluster biosynthetic enzyme
MTGEPGESLIDRIREALRNVIDPEIGYNIVDLGLVYDVAVKDDGAACITMTTTTQGCPATSYLAFGARESASSVPGVQSVDINLTYEPPWTPKMISPEAKQHLGISDGDGW